MFATQVEFLKHRATEGTEKNTERYLGAVVTWIDVRCDKRNPNAWNGLRKFWNHWLGILNFMPPLKYRFRFSFY
jgi:hypothetical protein